MVVPGQHHEDEKLLFPLTAQPSQGFWYNHSDDSTHNVLLVLFSKHSKPGQPQVKMYYDHYKTNPDKSYGFQEE